MSVPSWVEGFAGTVQGSFFRPPAFVDVDKPAGATSLKAVVPDMHSMLKGYISLQYFFFSPNFVWFVIAAMVYVVFPYDTQASLMSHLATRAVINTGLVWVFFGFWHASLYGLGWGTRPFNPNREYKFSKLGHNVFYSTLGALQWSLWEMAFLHIYSSGRLPHDSSISALIVWSLLVPLIRDLHFYFAHRFM